MFGDIGKFWNKYQSWIFDGIKITLLVSLISIILGMIIGIIIGYFRNVHISRKDNYMIATLKKGTKYVFDGYMLFFRYTPFIAQAFFFYFVIFSKFQPGDGEILNKEFLVGTIALSLNVGAFIAKTIEGGLISINSFQYKAGRSLGLSHRRTFFAIVLPQAFKNIVPQLSNEFVNTIKATSVLSVIGLGDLMKTIKDGGHDGYDVAAAFTISIFIYFIICLIFSLALTLFNRWMKRRG